MTEAITHHLRFRTLGRFSFFGGVLATIAIHGLLGSLVWYAHFREAPPPEVVRDVVITKTITFGKPREKFWLPKKPVQPKPTAPEPTVRVTDNLEAAAKPKEAPRPDDPDTSKDMKRALERARMLAAANAEEPLEGSLTGSRNSTATESSEGDPYATAVYDAIRKNWNVPTGLSLGAASNLEIDVMVTMSADGALGEPRVRKSSGNDLFDASCIEAVKATRQVPPPPPRFRKGMVLTFEGKDLAR